ncbi:unnamed protein product, partial [Musa textilis]
WKDRTTATTNSEVSDKPTESVAVRRRWRLRSRRRVVTEGKKPWIRRRRTNCAVSARQVRPTVPGQLLPPILRRDSS